MKHQDRTGERYLIDETTGIVRFIFRLKSGLAAEKKDWKDIFDPPKKRKLGIADQRKLDQERVWVRFIFWKIFVRSIIEAVNGGYGLGDTRLLKPVPTRQRGQQPHRVVWIAKGTAWWVFVAIELRLLELFWHLHG